MNRIRRPSTVIVGVLAAWCAAWCAGHAHAAKTHCAIDEAIERIVTPIERWVDDVADRFEPPAPGDRVFGLTFVADEDDRMPPERFAALGGEMPARVVILVHGLDDPGWMWRDVIPPLRQAGYVVARMEYPNDGPISESADLFAMALLDLRKMGVERVDVVAHSMGGLVTRDVLTRHPYYAGDGGGGERWPAIDRFIMCGTPNHGSQLARLRGVAEVKEHLGRAFSGSGSWLGGLSDGNGEAAADLLPNSVFLTRLNERPLASHTRHTIIAGVMSPVSEEDVSGLGRTIRDAARDARAPSWLRDWIDSAEEETSSVLRGAVRGVGDGCVALDSARLDGVRDLVKVKADHVTMIVNVLPGAEGDPPVVPIILARLARELEPPEPPEPPDPPGAPEPAEPPAEDH